LFRNTAGHITKVRGEHIGQPGKLTQEPCTSARGHGKVGMCDIKTNLFVEAQRGEHGVQNIRAHFRNGARVRKAARALETMHVNPVFMLQTRMSADSCDERMHVVSAPGKTACDLLRDPSAAPADGRPLVAQHENFHRKGKAGVGAFGTRISVRLPRGL
jgi:hypothetical protein